MPRDGWECPWSQGWADGGLPRGHSGGHTVGAIFETAEWPGGDLLGAGPAEVLEYALELLAGAAAPAEACIAEHGVTVTPTLLEQALLGYAARLHSAYIDI